MNLHPTSLYLTNLLCLLWLSSDFPTLYQAYLMRYSTAPRVFLSAQQQLQFPLCSLIFLSTAPTNPSHAHMALHQNPYTPLMYPLTPSTVFSISPWFQPIFLQLACSATKNQHQLHLACSWCANCLMMHNTPSTQPATAPRSPGRRRKWIKQNITLSIITEHSKA